MVNTNKRIHCFLAGKERMTRKKFVLIPCLELVVAVLLVKVTNFLNKEVKTDCFCKTYWSDSKIGLGYIGIPRNLKYLLPTEFNKYKNIVMWNNGDMS